MYVLVRGYLTMTTEEENNSGGGEQQQRRRTNCQMIGGPPKAHRALIEVTVDSDMTKAVALVADFMIMEMGRGKGYSSFPTSP